MSNDVFINLRKVIDCYKEAHESSIEIIKTLLDLSKLGDSVHVSCQNDGFFSFLSDYSHRNKKLKILIESLN